MTYKWMEWSVVSVELIRASCEWWWARTTATFKKVNNSEINDISSDSRSHQKVSLMSTTANAHQLYNCYCSPPTNDNNQRILTLKYIHEFHRDRVVDYMRALRAISSSHGLCQWNVCMRLCAAVKSRSSSAYARRSGLGVFFSGAIWWAEVEADVCERKQEILSRQVSIFPLPRSELRHKSFNLSCIPAANAQWCWKSLQFTINHAQSLQNFDVRM